MEDSSSYRKSYASAIGTEEEMVMRQLKTEEVEINVDELGNNVEALEREGRKVTLTSP